MSAKDCVRLASFFLVLALAVPAQAATIYIDAIVSGCSGGPDGQACSGGAAHMFPNATVNLINPETLTLGPGTYSITNGALSGQYSAWNFSGGWVWNWGITTDNGNATGNVFYVAGSGGVFGSQAASAGAHLGNYGGAGGPVLPLLDATGGPDNFYATFTLPATTTLDFFVLDYYGPDNAGGIALNINEISSVPEPSTWAMLTLGLAGVAFAAYRRKSKPALMAA